MKKLYVLLLLFLIPYFVFAEEFKYFTFSPFTDTYLDISLLKSITQIFYPFDDNLNAFRIWIKNEDESAQIKVSLLKENTLIKAKTFYVPMLNKNLGNEFKLDFGENIPIRSGEEYKLKIDHISGKGLRIFYSNLIQLLQHSEEYSLIENFVGPLYLNNSSSSYAINFTLSEKEENNPPQFKDVKVDIISPYKVVMNFQTNEPVKYKLVYWNSIEEKVNVIDFIEYLENCYKPHKCKFVINAQPNTLYVFQIGIKDYWNNLNAYQGTFITPYDPSLSLPTASPTSSPTSSLMTIEDKVPPTILSFDIIELTTTTITIKFTTNEYTTAKFSIYTGKNNLVLTQLSPIFDILHIISSKPVLIPNYKYYAILKVEDINNNSTTLQFEFITSPQGTIKEIMLSSSTLPVISFSESIEPTPKILVGNNNQYKQLFQKSSAGIEKENYKDKTIINTTFDSKNKEFKINIPQDQLANFRVEIYDKDKNLIKKIENIKSNIISFQDLKEGVYTILLRDKNSSKLVFQKEIEIKNKLDKTEQTNQRIGLEKAIYKSYIKQILIILLVLYLIFIIYKLIK